MSADLVFAGADGEPFTTSLVIAAETGNEHASVIKLIRDNATDLSEVGTLRFEIAKSGGRPTEFAELDEPAAALLMTYLRNNPVVKDFKKRLVAGFYAMRQALAQRPAPVALPSKRELAQWVVEAEDRAEREAAARAEAEQRAAALTGPASAYQQLVDAAGDWAVDDAAKVLSRDPLISTGERRLYQFMSGLGWVFKRDGRWKAYQTQIENGRLAEKPGRPFWHAGREETVNGEPTVRITPKGLAELHKRLGGSGQLALVAAS
jgi:phage regulator Rha-like protein